jgi:hypothetical protein
LQSSCQQRTWSIWHLFTKGRGPRSQLSIDVTPLYVGAFRASPSCINISCNKEERDIRSLFILAHSYIFLHVISTCFYKKEQRPKTRRPEARSSSSKKKTVGYAMIYKDLFVALLTFILRFLNGGHRRWRGADLVARRLLRVAHRHGRRHAKKLNSIRNSCYSYIHLIKLLQVLNFIWIFYLLHNEIFDLLHRFAIETLNYHSFMQYCIILHIIHLNWVFLLNPIRARIHVCCEQHTYYNTPMMIS